jgi:N-acetylglucosaminyldiphosphoundecaprenol N-acetyl-beta-D-mannosaminyltransferase
MGDVNLLGVRVTSIDKGGLQLAITKSIRVRSKEVFAYVNVHALNIAQQDEPFRRFLNDAAVTYCDGEGVRLGARILGQALPSRIVLTYWVWDLCSFCEREGFSLFVLGGERESIEVAVRRMRQEYPALKILGYHHGFFEKTGPENTEVLGKIARTQPDILIVGFGMPLQEQWINTNLAKLSAHVILPAGSMIEYVAGKKRPAPSWMANHGMEWVYRLVQEPRRLWRRYLLGNPLFLARILMERMKGKVEG